MPATDPKSKRVKIETDNHPRARIRRRVDNSFPMAAIQSRVLRVQRGEERDGAIRKSYSTEKGGFEDEPYPLIASLFTQPSLKSFPFFVSLNGSRPRDRLSE